MASISARKAQDPLVLAVDIGSSASRGRLFDATGAPVRGTRQRLPHTIESGADGSAVLDPELVFDQVSEVIDGVLATGSYWNRIGGVAMDTFASSLIGVDADGTPLTPCITYADTRSAQQVIALRAELDEPAVQQRTGCRFSTSYLPAQIRWLHATDPATSERVTRWLSLGEYIFGRLLGTYGVSYSIAAWSGMLNRAPARWDDEMLSAAGVHAEQLSPLRDTTEPLDGAGSPAAHRWPALAQARWYPAVADGYASNVGSGAVDGGAMALAAGTSGALRVLVDGVPEQVPAGLWCYRVDRRRSLYGGALNDVGRLSLWLRTCLRLPKDDAELSAALAAPPDEGTPAVLPFLTGERSPGWAALARAAFDGITASTDALALWRGAMEGVALRYGLIADELATVAPLASRVVASGGVVEATPGWIQIVADVLGRPVTRSIERNATMWGTALIALDALAPDVPRALPRTGETADPRVQHAGYYRKALDRQQRLYARLVDHE
jgi:gluconokinase